ncbi:hypothetical protein SASPL_140205 [Salvia splendens]|uniref:Uncharacterized protein n=1 Tax=Salvia splendens TaxID=180675 RepID=A0A8X8WQ09_SALSN|nr:hypothetical protein SASPL_140205 [Salvia splendens]
MDQGGGSVNSTVTAAGTEPSYPSNSIFFQLSIVISSFRLRDCAVIEGFLHMSSRYMENNWDLKQLVGSGGHALVSFSNRCCSCSGRGFQQGFGGSQFGLALILALVVMYDATGVRLHAGRQAEVLNQIIYELPSEHPLAESRPLRELLGHTPPQVVAGATLGLVTAATGHFLFNSGTRA